MAELPENPTPQMTDGLARDIVMWRDMDDRTGEALYLHLRRKGSTIPDWLPEVIPNRRHVPPKAAVAAAIYRAMVEAHHADTG